MLCPAQARLPRRTVAEGDMGDGEWLLEHLVALLADPHMLRTGHSFRDASRTNIDLVLALYRQHNCPAAPATALAAASRAPPYSLTTHGSLAQRAAGPGHVAAVAASNVADIAIAVTGSAAESHAAMAPAAHRTEVISQLRDTIPLAVLAHAGRPRHPQGTVSRGQLSGDPLPGDAEPAAAVSTPLRAVRVVDAVEEQQGVARRQPRLDQSVGQGLDIADTGSGVTDGRAQAWGQSACSASPRMS